MNKGIGGHQRAYEGRTDDWLTPPEIVQALGPFDLDPCCPKDMPWRTATMQLFANGLELLWTGRVWLNPPYGPRTHLWLKKLAQHGNGIALIFARTETEMFHRLVWEMATAVLFLEGRLHFHYPDGTRAEHNAGGPSALVAYGDENANRLLNAKLGGAIKGHFIRLR